MNNSGRGHIGCTGLILFLFVVYGVFWACDEMGALGKYVLFIVGFCFLVALGNARGRR